MASKQHFIVSRYRKHLGAVILYVTGTYVLDSEREVIRSAVAGERQVDVRQAIAVLESAAK